MYKRLACAGKRIHEVLLSIENEGVPEMIQKYQQECQLMSSLRHPNITLFLGLCFLPGTQIPLLVMERLETSLDDLVENMPNIPLAVKRSILENVASGLLYLHERNPPVIHRDLTSRNVLLTSFLVAKITDMGNSRIVRPGQVVGTLSALPGTLTYMPPEAQDDAHRYGPSLDVFSFGHLALFTITQRYPGELLPSTYPDPENPSAIRGRTELERRGRYIDMLESMICMHHPALVELVKECLQNVPDRRPTTVDLLVRLQSMREEVEGGLGSGAVRVDLSQIKLFREIRMKDRRLEELTEQQERQEAELEEKTRQLEEIELMGSTDHLAQKDQEIARKDREISSKDQQIASKDQEIAQQRGRNQQLVEEIHLRETRLSRVREELQSKEAEISRLREELSKTMMQQKGKKRRSDHMTMKDQTIAINEREIESKNQELVRERGRNQQLQEELQGKHLRETRLMEELRNREAEITRLREEQSNYLKQGGVAIQGDGVVDITDPAECNARYPGIVSFKTSIAESVTSSGTEIDYLEDMGISISIAEDSVSPGDAPLDLVVSPCFSGPFELPEGYESASTAYLIDIPQLDKLQKDITIRIQHHIHLQTTDDCEDMVFLTASATPQLVRNRQVYSFNISSNKPVFKCGNQIGEISLRDFGLLKAGKRRIRDTSNEFKDFQHHYYSVRLYENLLNEGRTSAVLCICLYNSLYIKHCNSVIARGYTGMTEKAEGRSEIVAEIDGNEVLFYTEKEKGLDVSFDKIPALIKKRDIHLPEKFDIDIIAQEFTDYPPRLKIKMEQTEAKCAPPRIQVVGLDRRFSFVCHGTRFYSVNQTEVDHAVERGRANVVRRPEVPRRQVESSHLRILQPGSVQQAAVGTSTHTAAGSAPNLSIASASQIPILDNKDTTDRHLLLIYWVDETGCRQTLKLFEGMSSKWMEIGTLIGIEGITLQNYASQHRGNPAHCIRAVVNDWKMMCSTKYPSSWDGLLKLLEDAELNQLALKLRQAASSPNSTLFHD